MDGLSSGKHVGFAENCAGFTLMELLIALAISGLILTAVYKVFMSNNLIYLKQNELTKIEQNMRAAMNKMIREVRMAGYNNTDDSVSYTKESDQQIIFKYNDHNATFYFDEDNKSIKQKDGNKIATNIGNLIFDCNNTNCQIDITIESYSDKNNIDIPTLQMSRTVYIRNACLDD